MDYFVMVQDKLAEQLGVDKSKITMETDVVADLGADSLDMVELFMCLEDEMNITIEDEVAMNLKTVGDIVKLLETTLAPKK